MNITQLPNDMLRIILLGELRGMQYLSLVCKKFRNIIKKRDYNIYPKLSFHSSIVCDQFTKYDDIFNMAKISPDLFDNVINCQFINSMYELYYHADLFEVYYDEKMLHNDDVIDIKLELCSPMSLYVYKIYNEYSHIDTSNYLPKISLYTLLIATIMSDTYHSYAYSIIYLHLYFNALKNHIKGKYKKLVKTITNAEKAKNIQIVYAKCMQICNNYKIKNIHFMYALIQISRLNDVFNARVFIAAFKNHYIYSYGYRENLTKYSLYYFNLDIVKYMLKCMPEFVITRDIFINIYNNNIHIDMFACIKINNILYSHYCAFKRHFTIDNSDRNKNYSCIDVLKCILDVETKREDIFNNQGRKMLYNNIVLDYVDMLNNIISHNESSLTNIIALISSYDITGDGYLSKLLCDVVKNHLYQNAKYGITFQNYFG